MTDSLAGKLLVLARQVIVAELESQKIETGALLEEYPELTAQRACFITLTQNGQLRGCIGSLIPHRSLIEDVIHNSKAAAFSDPRFQQVTLPEMESIQIELSVLSVPEMLEYQDTDDLRQKLRPQIDGVILKSGMHQATFLPQVWEQLPEFDGFFAHLCNKAGLNGDCLESHPEIYTYQAEKYKEEDIGRDQ